MSVVVAGFVISHESELTFGCFGENVGVELESVEIGRKLLSYHAFSVVDLEEIACQSACIGRPAVPHFAAEDDNVPGFAHEGFLPLAFPFDVAIRTAAREMASRDEVGWSQFLSNIIEVEMCCCDEDG